MIEWRWGLEPMTLRDRYAKNFAEALDFTQRRPAIDLPPYDPPRAGACAAGGGWLELQASRDGSVKVICDGPPSADCSATLMGLVSKLALAQVPVTRIGQGSKVVLELKLTDEARPSRIIGSNACPTGDNRHRREGPDMSERLLVDPHPSRQPLGAAREAQ